MRIHLKIKMPIRQRNTKAKIQGNAALERRDEGIPRKPRNTKTIQTGRKKKIIRLRNTGYQQPDVYVCFVARESHKASHDVCVR